MRALTAGLILSAVTALTPVPGVGQRVDCELAPQSGGAFAGPCTGFHEGRGTLDLRPDDPISGGPAPMALPTDLRWTGTLQIPGWPALGIEIESSPYEPEPALVMKTQVAWLLVEAPTIDLNGVAFWLQFDEDAPPTRDDLEILTRAEEILWDEGVWDRSASKRCRPGAKTWTLFCAMRDATVEVTGEFHPKQPAVVILENVIQEVFREMAFDDPIVDYNTYEDAILVEMHRLLGQAQAQVRREL